MSTIDVDKKRSALLLMDYQTAILPRIPDKAPGVLAAAKTLRDKARAAGVPVIYVVVGFRPGYPEVSASNPVFGQIRQTGMMVITTPGADIAPEVAPGEGDIVVVKRRVSAFTGSDLEVVLRANGVETLVLGGVATSGVVLSTTRQAADADYRIVIARDACADADDEVHRVLLDKVLARQAKVVTADDITFG